MNLFLTTFVSNFDKKENYFRTIISLLSKHGQVILARELRIVFLCDRTRIIGSHNNGLLCKTAIKKMAKSIRVSPYNLPAIDWRFHVQQRDKSIN